MIAAISCILLLLFGFVILFGAPYLPTLKPQVKTAFELLDLKPGQTLLELGSGDGRVMREAAKRGLRVVGYELNPFLVVVSMFVTVRYRENVTVIWGNFWTKNWPPADGAFVFLLDRYMPKLESKIENSEHKPKKLVSFAFQIPGKKPAKTKNGLFLYVYSRTLKH